MLLAVDARAQADAALDARLDALDAQVTAAEDVSALKRLQREYGYYVDKGMWEDVADLYADDAVANYPAGTYIGKDSIRKHLYMNVGGGQVGENGLPENRIYNHINIQPVVHLDPGGQTGKGRWRAFAMFGSYGGGATWAEGVYEMTYTKDHGVWKIKNLDYHSGFGAAYATGWVPPEPRPAAAAGGGGGGRGALRNLPHPADKPREEACAGFPAACVGPFHYTNPGVTDAGHVWSTVALSPATGRKPAARDRAQALAERAQRLADEQEVENLQKIYGYYLDRRMWDDVANLFADNGTIEMGQQGVYVGRARVRQFLNLLGPAGIGDGELNDHVQLQVVVDVAPDGRTAKARSRELNMTGELNKHGEWSEGVYENTFVKDNGVWKLKDLRYFPTFSTDYDQGWAKDAKPAPGASRELPPDRPPTSVYAIYPKPHIPPYHYDNPVSGSPPRYPEARGRPSAVAIAAVRAPVAATGARPRKASVRDVAALVAETEKRVGRVKDFHEIDNLVSAYGYYLDKNLWNDLANLFSANGSIELAQRGSYVGRERVRGFLFNVFGKEGPSENRLGNHIQYQAVVHVAPDGQSAKVRSRMLQQLNFGQRASMGASLYENEFVKEGGVWKFSVDHTFNTWTAGYDGGWARNPGRGVPGPSKAYPPDTPPTFVFQMFPTVYEIPFHYPHPVTGRQTSAATPNPERTSAVKNPSVDLGMPPEIAAGLRTIGPRIEVDKTTALYAPLQPKEPYAWLKVTRDLRYGPAERNVLDVFASPEAGSRQARGRVRARRRLCARRETRRRHAVLRQHRALGRGLRVRRRHHQLPARAAEHVAFGYRGCRRRRHMAQGQRRAVRWRSEQDRALGTFRRRRARRRLRREPGEPRRCGRHRGGGVDVGVLRSRQGSVRLEDLLRRRRVEVRRALVAAGVGDDRRAAARDRRGARSRDVPDGNQEARRRAYGRRQGDFVRAPARALAHLRDLCHRHGRSLAGGAGARVRAARDGRPGHLRRPVIDRVAEHDEQGIRQGER